MRVSIELKQVFKLSIPTLFAYFSLSMLFTILWLKAGFAGYWAVIMSLFAYSGAVQFVVISMMQEHASVLAILFASSFIACRNLFYGFSLLDRFRPKPKWIKAFLMFGLVDAVYGVLASNPETPERDDTKFCLYATLLPYIYWQTGSVFGLILFSSLPDIKGLNFMLTSFFMLLVIDYYLVSRDIWSLVMPIVFSGISFLILPGQYLVVAIISSALFIYLSDQYKAKKTKGA